jgi:hypothetical protein
MRRLGPPMAYFGQTLDLDADSRRIRRELDAIRVHSLG